MHYQTPIAAAAAVALVARFSPFHRWNARGAEVLTCWLVFVAQYGSKGEDVALHSTRCWCTAARKTIAGQRFKMEIVTRNALNSCQFTSPLATLKGRAESSLSSRLQRDDSQLSTFALIYWQEEFYRAQRRRVGERWATEFY